jgi:hypothetical protein
MPCPSGTLYPGADLYPGTCEAEETTGSGYMPQSRLRQILLHEDRDIVEVMPIIMRIINNG